MTNNRLWGESQLGTKSLQHFNGNLPYMDLNPQYCKNIFHTTLVHTLRLCSWEPISNLYVNIEMELGNFRQNLMAKQW